MLEKIEETTEWLQKRMTSHPTVAIILGSGLGRLGDDIEVEQEFRYADIPNFPVSTVEGHAGKLIIGRLGGCEVIAMAGRFHFYEGYTMKEVTFPIRVFYALGVKYLFASNAAGGTNPSFHIGDLMLITDHINMLPENPLRGKNLPTGPRFPDMSDAYDAQLRQMALEEAHRLHIDLQQGIYLATQGPTYETPAEYRMFRLLGADAVGMSTVPEIIVANHCGIRCLGISVITNIGQASQQVSHEEVEAAAAAAQPKMSAIFKEMLRRVAVQA
jgi:purine-nucleoside phosphorylase